MSRCWIFSKFNDGSMDAATAINYLLPSMGIERTMLQTYAKQEKATDHDGAFHSLPRTVRLLYVHAVQSFLFNQMASLRMKDESTRLFAIRGDLVVQEDDIKKYSQVHLVTAEEEEKKTYSIHHVVLPILGSASVLPENETRKVIDDFRSGVDDAVWDNPGVYRKLMAQPLDVDWKVLRYSDATADLMENGFNQVTETSEGQSRALRISFSLGSSEYATMLIRELTKTDSTIDSQINMQNKAADEIAEQAAAETAELAGGVDDAIVDDDVAAASLTPEKTEKEVFESIEH